MSPTEENKTLRKSLFDILSWVTLDIEDRDTVKIQKIGEIALRALHGVTPKPKKAKP